MADRQLTFSVIIPAYNARKTLQRCLDSILSTNYLAIEALVIDDGSNDGTAQLVETYASEDSRVRLITQKNNGPAAARNRGLQNAIGDIITFVDSDDMIQQNYFEELNQVFQQTDSEVVFFDFARVTENNSVISYHKLPKLSTDYYQNLMSLSDSDIFGYTWIKAFRRSVLSEIRFNENMLLFEDELFTVEALKKPLKIYYLHKELYHYVCEGNTSLARRTHENYQELYDVVYCAWKELLNNRREGVNFLKKKAKHLSFVCKYYGLERVSNPMVFFKRMSECLFLKDAILEDSFLVHIREKNWGMVRGYVLSYKLKTCISKIVKHGIS